MGSWELCRFAMIHTAAIGIATVIAGQGLAAESSMPETTVSFNSEPYCGIYGLYRAMDILGLTTDLRELIKPEYVGSALGSSADELIKAARDHKAYAELIPRMTLLMLAEVNRPVLLHVKGKTRSKEYNHQGKLILACPLLAIP